MFGCSLRAATSVLKTWWVFRTGREFPCILKHRKFHCRLRNSSPKSLILIQMYPAHNLTQFFGEFTEILRFHILLDQPSGFLPSGCPGRNSVLICRIYQACYMCSQSPVFNRPNYIWWKLKIMNLLITQHYPVSCYEVRTSSCSTSQPPVTMYEPPHYAELPSLLLLCTNLLTTQ